MAGWRVGEEFVAVIQRIGISCCWCKNSAKSRTFANRSVESVPKSVSDPIQAVGYRRKRDRKRYRRRKSPADSAQLTPPEMND